MTHQLELEKKKYKNWVRGGLAYKYLKEGIEGFADDVVQQEHKRILSAINHTPGLVCKQCCLGNLRSKHQFKKDHAGRKKCPWGQKYCNCMFQNKQQCPYNICEAIMEEILNCHGSTPPAPKWENTDIQQWCSSPWEVGKCFINAPGYSKATKAADIDASGLLHVFINNKILHSHLACSMSGRNIFVKTRERRNTLFHSPTMEMEDTELIECIDGIIGILEDPKELNARHDAQQAVSKLKQLKQQDFNITTHNEVEVCRAALASITKKSEELTQSIKAAKVDIDMKQAGATKAIDDKMETALQDALEALTNHGDIKTLKQAVELLNKKVNNLESDHSAFRQEIQQRLIKIENAINTLDAARDETTKKLKYVEEKKELQKSLVQLYQNHYVSTSISPLKLQQNNINVKEVYVAPEMVLGGKSDQHATKQVEPSPNKPDIKILNGYREVLQTNGQEHKQIYIVGDVGTGKSTFCKMMIQHWCSAVTEECPVSAYKKETENPNKMDIFPENENINEMKKFEFLFFVHLQRMSELSDLTEMIKAIVADVDLASTDLIDRIFQQESGNCLIIADGLDEWSPPRNKCLLPHVSYGLPKRDRAKHATVVTLSRPSAKGILNMKSTECDQQVELLGIKRRSVNSFVETYLSKINKTGQSSRAFMMKIKKAKLEHLEKTPLFLQQLVWLYCTGNEIASSISDTYSQIVNIMLGWCQNKEEMGTIDESQTSRRNEEKDVILPMLLKRFPRCDSNKRFLLPLARVAFEALTSEMGSSTFRRSHLHTKGVSDIAINELIKLGILVEENCFNPTEENTQLEFIHISYLEFFAAVHVSCHSNEDQQTMPTLKNLFLKFKSAADILQISNILKMICGLSPSIIQELSICISEIVSRDENIISYRYSISDFQMHCERQDPEQIQCLIVNCLSENDSDDEPMVSLCDVIINRSTKMSFLQRIIPENVLSLCAERISDVEVWRWIAGLKQLQYMYIGNNDLSHSEVVLLLSMIQEAPLKHISMYLVHCTESDCDDHNIDLSKHDQLQSLQLNGCRPVNISNINTERLEILQCDPPNILDINLLLNASRLTLLDLCGPFTDHYTKQMNSVVHTLQQLRELRLYSINFDDTALTVTPEMKNLEHIELWDVRMSLQTWCTFVDSFLTLHQSVQVDIYDCSVCEDMNGDGRNYVRQNKMFEVIEAKWPPVDFSFKSKK